MRIGVFGGTFDPVHLGHLILADQCREQARLDQVLFIPAARPPPKLEQPLTPFAQRVEMLQLALAGQPAFRVDELEKDRPGPSYTVDTLEELQRRDSCAELFLIIGSDCLPDLASWLAPSRIAELATLLVAPRSGSNLSAPEHLRVELQLPSAVELRHQRIWMPLIGISSRELRQKVSRGGSIRYLVPRAIECYIEAQRLYLGNS